MEKEYYLDSCIWINLFKKEGNPAKEVPYWILAKEFIEQVEHENRRIVVSTIVLKELSFQLGEKWGDVQQFFKEAEFIDIVKTSDDDYVFAREAEQRHGLLSFYDYLHVFISKRLNTKLITRDNELIKFARNHVEVFKPEQLL
ncbi:PIN domain-containing protein [Candidatus Woesearchaeota archaeon]|nr:PIN domain-containing protein [Candidatus Woesearchaeota archaeon]